MGGDAASNESGAKQTGTLLCETWMFALNGCLQVRKLPLPGQRLSIICCSGVARRCDPQHIGAF